jgi:hypothetical protein
MNSMRNGANGATIQFCRSSSSAKSKNFAEQRSEYNEKLTKLRGLWSKDIKSRNEAEALRKQQERDLIVLKRAKALRIKRAAAKERQEQARLFRARMMELYRARLAKAHFLAEQRDELQQDKYDRFVRDLSDEAKTYLTHDNVDALITEELFSRPATTGLVSPLSEHWKYYAITYPYEADRTPHEDSGAATPEDPWERKKLARAEARGQARLMLRDMLEEVVNDGEQRENLEKYIDKLDEVLPVSDDDLVRSFGMNKEDEN